MWISYIIKETRDEADNGDYYAKTIMREYFTPGESLALYDYIKDYDYSAMEETNIYSARKNFTMEYGAYLYAAERELMEEQLSDMTGYVHNEIPEIINLSNETIAGLDAETMEHLADALDKYSRSHEALAVPIKSLINEISIYNDELKKYRYIEEHENDDAAELRTEARNANTDAENAITFASQALEILNANGQSTIEKIQTLLSLYDNLDPNVRTNLDSTNLDSTNLDSQETGFTDFKEYMETMRQVLFDYNSFDLASDFTASTNIFTLEEFLDARCQGCNAEERNSLRKVLLSYSEMSAYSEEDPAGSLLTYLDERRTLIGYTDELYAKMREFVFVSEYIDIVNGGIPAFGYLNNEFSDFSRYYYLENYLAAIEENYNNAPDKAAFISRSVADFMSTAGEFADASFTDEYLTFGTDYYSGIATSFAHLPEEAQFFTAYDDYYNTVFMTGTGLDSEEDIAGYISGFTGKGYSANLDAALRQYISDLNAVDDYYGQNAGEYIEGLSDNGKDMFERYYYFTMNTGDDALWPGWNAGISGIAMEMSAGAYVASYLLEEHVDDFLGDFNMITKGLTENADRKYTGLQYADALYQYQKNPGSFASFRNFLLPDGSLTPVDDDETNDDESGVDLHSDTSVSAYRDEYADGNINTYKKYGRSHEGEMLESMRMETMNEIAKRLEYIASASVSGIFTTAGDTTDNPLSISTYIDAVRPMLEAGNESGISVLNSNVAGTVGDTGSGSLPLADLLAEIGNAGSMLASYKAQIVSKGQSYYEMKGNSLDALKENLEDIATARDNATAAYETAEAALGNAQEAYTAANNDYVNQMNTIASNYAAFKNAEFDYERAYAVWEYANTPYLMGTSIGDSGIESGEDAVNEEGIIDLSTLPKPDAKENYQTILTQFTAAQTKFNEARTAMQNQDTDADLRADTEYTELRNDLEDKTESYIRTNRADILMQKDIEELKKDLEKAQKEYENTKKAALGQDSRTIKVDGETQTIQKPGNYEGDINTLIDQILARMLKGSNSAQVRANVTEYVDRFILYAVISEDLKHCRDNIDKALEEYNTAAAALANYEVQSPYDTYFSTLQYNYYTKQDAYFDLRDGIPVLEAAMANMNNSIIRDDIALMEKYNLKYDIDIMNTLVSAAKGQTYKLIDKRNCTTYSFVRWMHRGGSDGYGGDVYEYGTNYSVGVHWEKKYNRDRTAYWTGDYKALLDDALSKAGSLQKAHTRMIDKFTDVYTAKMKVINLQTQLRTLDEARNITAVKSVLQSQKYSLNTDDLINVYDYTTVPITGNTDESINITSLRREVKRTDTDGHDARAVVSSGRVYILDINGTRTGENYAAADTSIILRDADGNQVASENFVNNTTYDFSDFVYSVSEVAHVMSEDYKSQQNSMKTDYYNYCGESVRTGEHDSTVILRDQEALYWNLLHYAGTFLPAVENKPRSYDGYKEALAELVYNGGNNTIDDRIVQSLISQNSAFQEQVWTQQEEKFQERKNRWMEIVNFIKNRGMRDWNNRMVELANDWRKWRFDARQAIEEGEQEWLKTAADFNKRVAGWQAKMAESGSVEEARNSYASLEAELSRYLGNFNQSMPAGVELNIDLDSILSKALRNIPAANLGILSESAGTTDITAGFAQMLNLNLSSDLQKRYDQEMDNYEDKMKIMQNLRMTELFKEILKSFNEELNKANDQIYDQVNYDLRWNGTFCEAPFQRNTETNEWSIRYIEDYSLTSGEEYETLTFGDYKRFENKTVFLKPFNGLNGKINFNEPSTYVNLDADELETFVGLEVQHLNDEIENTFKNGDITKDLADGSNPEDGYFVAHAKDEMQRLGGRFSKGYEEWAEGEAKTGSIISTPIFVGGPSPRIVVQAAATIVATYFGGPGAGFAVTAAFTVGDAVAGNITWEQAGMQLMIAAVAAYAGGAVSGAVTAGVGSAAGQFAGVVATTAVNTAASGIKYNPDGSMSWDNDQFKAGLKSGAVNIALAYVLKDSNAVLKSGVTGFVNSGIDTDNGSWWKIGWNDTGDALASGAAAGAATYFTSRIAGEQESAKKDGNTVFEKTDYTGTFSYGDYTNKILYNTINSGFMSMYNMAAHDMSWSDASTMTGFWEGMNYNVKDIGGFLGTWAADPKMMDKEELAKRKKAQMEAEQASGAGNSLPADPLQAVEDLVLGLWQGLKTAGSAVADIFSSIAEGASDFAESAGNWIAGDGLRTDEQIAVDTARELLDTYENDPASLAKIDPVLAQAAWQRYFLNNMQYELAGFNSNPLDIMMYGEDGKNQRNNDLLTDTAKDWNMCNLTSLADGLEKMGVNLDIAKNLLSGLGYTGTENITQLEDALDVIRDMKNLGYRGDSLVLAQLAQMFPEIAKMNTELFKNGNLKGYKYEDGTNVINQAGEVLVNTPEEAKEYYSKLLNQIGENGFAILSTLLTNDGHLVTLLDARKDGILVNDPYGYKDPVTGTYIVNNKIAEYSKGSTTYYSYQDVFKYSMGITTPSSMKARWNMIIRRNQSYRNR